MTVAFTVRGYLTPDQGSREFERQTLECDRCGALVLATGQESHRRWHEEQP